MTATILNEYVLGDMVARYLLDEESGMVGLILLPLNKQSIAFSPKNYKVESLVQLKLTGDIYDEAYAMGMTMRNSETVRCLRYESQSVKEENKRKIVETLLESARGYRVIHRLMWLENTPYVRIQCKFENTGSESLKLEMFESFSLSGISPYLEGDGHECMYLHRMRSVWSQEGRHEAIPIEDLQLEPAWAPHAVRCERFGQAGSMPVNKFFPFGALEDRKNHIFWGAQIAHNASWQMEIYRKNDGISMSGGLADRELGHWMKVVKAGESFETPQAIVTVAHTDSFAVFTERLTRSALESLECVPESEKDLPIIFNEYCTTWGNPSHENIMQILNCIKGKGFRYFVIDCGWYKEHNVPWDIGMGDYEVSKELFPEGLEKTVDAIHEAGMIPGLWFEIENVGRASRAYHLEEHLLQKDGKTLTSYFRRFWNMQDPWVKEYLSEKVIGTLKKYGFGYMKIDYNETIGIGCDNEESIGEGLRKNMEASAAFFEKVKREIPEIVLENCSSGGHRLEPSLMAQMSMASFSDAHECKEIPIIAANLHYMIHPAQSQIWAVIRQTDSLKRIAYSIANTFLGRMCISGDVTQLDREQWNLIERGMRFYEKISDVIKEGLSYHFGTKVKSTRHPKGWQAVVRVGNNKKAYVVIHTFSGQLPEKIEILLPQNTPEQICEIYAASTEDVKIENHRLYYEPKENEMALAILLEEY